MPLPTERSASTLSRKLTGLKTLLYVGYSRDQRPFRCKNGARTRRVRAMQGETAHPDPDQTEIGHKTDSTAINNYETLLLIEGNGKIPDASPSKDEDCGSSNLFRSASSSSQKGDHPLLLPRVSAMVRLPYHEEAKAIPMSLGANKTPPLFPGSRIVASGAVVSLHFRLVCIHPTHNEAEAYLRQV